MDPHVAAEWMESKCENTIGAILIFEVEEFTTYLKDENFKGVDLSDINNPEIKQNWKDVINFYRETKEAKREAGGRFAFPECLKKILGKKQREEHIDYIIGHIWTKENQFQTGLQMCIKTQNMADSFSFLKKALFYKCPEKKKSTRGKGPGQGPGQGLSRQAFAAHARGLGRCSRGREGGGGRAGRGRVGVDAGAARRDEGCASHRDEVGAACRVG